MPPKIILAGVWTLVAASGWPDYSHLGWWAAVVVSVAMSGVAILLHRRADPNEALDRAVCKAVFHKNLDSITVVCDGKFLYANEEAVRSIGLSSMDGYLAASPAQYAPEFQPDGTTSAEKVRQMVAETFAKGFVRGEWTRRHADGRLIPVELTLLAFDVEGKRAVLVFYHDITERVRARQERENLLRTLADQVDERVGRVTREVKASSDALTADSTTLAMDMHQSSAQLARAAVGSKTASDNVNTIAAATEQLAGSVSQILEQVNSRSAITHAAVAESAAVTETINRLAQSGERIGDVANLIAGIATQTNMLALNATIEAARAGDAGRSFAVVANEVKNLAKRTAQATADVQEQVTQMHAAMTHAVGAIGRIGTTIEQLTGMIDDIGNAVHEQGTATHEIAKSIANASQGVTEAASGIAEVAETTRRSEDIAEQVKRRAGALDAEIITLHAEVENFRAAVGQA